MFNSPVDGMAELQTPLSFTYNATLRTFATVDESSKCNSIWDPQRARFTFCSLPYISAIPAVIALLIVFGYTISQFPIPRPKWTRAFVSEAKEDEDELERPSRPVVFWTWCLLSLSCVGLAIAITAVFYPYRRTTATYEVFAWAISAAIVILKRPKTAPISLLILWCTIFITDCIVVITRTHSSFTGSDAPAIVGLITALAGIITILCMPLRHPSLPSASISRVFTPPTSTLRSPEEAMTPWQWMSVSWMAPLVSLGSERQLHDEDVWDLAYEFKHRRLHDVFRELRGSVIQRLVRANGLDLVITTLLSTFELFANLSAPVILQQLLRSMEDPDAPRSAAITFAALSLLVRLAASQSSLFNLWFCRRAYERSRGEMITMLYEKTLNRKIVSAKPAEAAQDEANGNGHANSNGEANGYSNGKDSKGGSAKMMWNRVSYYVSLPFRWISIGKAQEAVKEPASMGKILNLMRNDVYEVAQRFWEFPNLITKPLGMILSIVLIWRILGWPCLLGMLAVIIAQIINAFVARAIVRWERKRRIATDGKLQKVSQFVEAIRHLRWYGWQETWLTDIMEARQHELNLRIVTGVLRLFISYFNSLASWLFPVIAFAAFTTLAGLPLRVDIAFPALDLFTMLESNLRDICNLITVLLNAAVAMGRIEDFMSEPDKEHLEVPPTMTTKLELKNASFAWPGAEENTLHDISLSFSTGLTVVYGEVASGKTALLQALLGELDKTGGDITRPDEMIGYCAQTPWLQSMSIRENILFSSPYEDARYKEVLNACALLADMANFKDGDLSNIGENGVGLSGGQKARVALARAVYSRSRILFLDDPISALDHQTAERIIHKCLAGPLLEGRTTILVTHRTELCHGLAKQWVEMSEGKATVSDHETESTHALHKTKSPEVVDEAEVKRREQEQLAAIPDKFIEEEHRAHGGVQRHVYWQYIKGGKLEWWFVLLLVMASYRVVDLANTWFIKAWGERYNQIKQEALSGIYDGLPPPEENIKPWLIVFTFLACALALITFFVQGTMLVITYFTGKRLFRDVMDRVAHASFRFYDVTPVGRLMNRLTSDITTIDGNISTGFANAAWSTISWVTALVTIASVTPVFLVFSLSLAAAFVIIFSRFLPTSQSLRRLEMVSLSPLMSNFGALLDGLTTVRAFSAQHRFQERVIEVTDKFQKMDHFYWSLQAWLTYRFDALSAFATLSLTLIAIYTKVSPGLTAFVLISASKFVKSTHILCKQYGSLQMDFVSVERVVELLDLEKESPGTIHPPAWWPSPSGDIVFENVTARYAPHLDTCLSSITLRIPAGSNTAIIGRTGSGKSTLALSLLATILPESGRILIDNIDITQVDRQTLRRRVTFLAQEPVLFPGTMRQNLDPLSEYPDDACADVLAKIADRHAWTLDMSIDAGGRGLSQGQRQLVGLARAMLRRSSVIILDEATASIDMETAQRIQTVLREEMKGSTVITIAHRLEAVKNADYCVVLGERKVLKAGNARDMLKEGEGEFRGLLG